MAKTKKKIDLRLPDLKGKKVLITGGLGFIGSNLAHKCLELGAEVTIYDSLDPRFGGNKFNIHGIKNSVKLVLEDLLNFDEISQHITDKDIVFNCAAATSHPFSMREPLVDVDINCKGTISLLEAIHRFNKDVKLVHLGTTTQIGKLHYSPADETHPEFPMDIYSANKSASEKYVLIYGTAYQMPVTVVRLPNVFGPRAAIHSGEFNFVNYFIGLALQGKEITVFGEGKQLRNVLYIDDCISALIMASQTDETNGEVLFAVGDNHYSVAEIAKSVAKYIGGTAKFIEWPANRKVIEVGDAVISNQKIKSILNWAPSYNLRTGLIKTKEYFVPCLKEYLRLEKK
jgi:UDP-glucose 4-epimerase